MSTELNVATTEYLGETWTFLDCPGFIELAQDAFNALMVVDAAVVVCEPEPQKVLTLAPLLRFLDERDIPHLVFVNKMDLPGGSIRDTLEALQALSTRPLVLREIPIREGEKISGFVDLVSERAFRWTEGQRSELIQLPEAVADREKEARAGMLEAIADFDDAPAGKAAGGRRPQSRRDLRRPRPRPAAGPDRPGVLRLGRGHARHHPAAEGAAPRGAGAGADGGAPGRPAPTSRAPRVFKTLHASHTGKLSLRPRLRAARSPTA